MPDFKSREEKLVWFGDYYAEMIIREYNKRTAEHLGPGVQELIRLIGLHLAETRLVCEEMLIAGLKEIKEELRGEVHRRT